MERQVENVKMAVHRNIELHYKKLQCSWDGLTVYNKDLDKIIGTPDIFL